MCTKWTQNLYPQRRDIPKLHDQKKYSQNAGPPAKKKVTNTVGHSVSLEAVTIRNNVQHMTKNTQTVALWIRPTLPYNLDLIKEEVP